MALRAVVVAALLSCPGCAVPPIVGYLAGLAGTAYGIIKDVNEGLEVTEDVVCATWGLYWKNSVPADLTGAREDVAIFCSGDPAVGSTPATTLVDLWGKVKAIRATQQVYQK